LSFCLKLGKNSLSTANRDLTSRLLLSICDLSILNYEGIATGAFTHGPVELLRESGLAREDLSSLPFPR
jgi:hypothetical protein